MGGKLIVSFLCLFFVNVHTEATGTTTPTPEARKIVENTTQTNASQENAGTETPSGRGLFDDLTKSKEDKQNIISIDRIIEFLTKAVQFLMDPVGSIRRYVRSVVLAIKENPVEFLKDLYGKGKKLFSFLTKDLPAQGQHTKEMLTKFLQLLKLVGMKS